MDVIKSKGYDVLVLTDDIDEFMISILGSMIKNNLNQLIKVI